nr:aquaporin [Weissella oryzae]
MDLCYYFKWKHFYLDLRRNYFMRKYIAEFIGTLLLVLMGTGAVVFAGTSYGPLPIAMAFAISVIAGAAALGKISGAHFNPAISLGAAIVGRITWVEFAGYLVSQFLGGIVATGILFGFMKAFGAKAATIAQVGFGQTSYTASLNFFSAAGIELVLTFFLVLVALMTTAKQNAALANVAPVAIGLVLGGLVMIGLSSTGGSLNPARSFGPALGMALVGSSTALANYAAYLVGPLLGGALAAVVAKYGLGSEE